MRGDWGEFYHWAKVAVDVARISPQVEMDINEVNAIVAQEGRLGGRMLDIRAACALRPAREAVAAAILSMPTGKTAGLTAAPLPALLFAASG